MERLLDVLSGLIPLPPTRFVSHEGDVDEDSWTRLLEALRSNREAVGVRLRSCGLGCARASQLAEVLANNAVLEVLELPDNAIGESGVQALVDALRLSNCTLKSVDLSGNPCSDGAVAAMQELDTLLKRNRVIKKLPRTPPPTAGGIGGHVAPGGGPVPKSASCTPGNGLSTPALPQSFLASAGMTPHGLSFALEQRLQHLEEAEATIRSELEHVRSFSSQSEVWQKKIDTAGQQIAAILSLVDSRNLALEARLHTMEHWRGGAEQAWAGQSKVLEDMAAQLLGLMRRVQLLEGQLARAADSSAAPGGMAGAMVSSGPALGVSLVQAPIAATLWLEMAALRERLAKLEAAASAAGAGRAPAAPTEAPAQQRHGQEQEQVQLEQPPAAADGAGGAAAQPPRPTSTADGGGGGLQGRRGVGIPALEVPGSPILWHVNTVAASPGSCGVTPSGAIPIPGHRPGQGRPVPPARLAEASRPPEPTAAAPASTNVSPGSAGSNDATVDLQAEPSCSGFVMYAAATAQPRTAAQRYDARDSVDFAAHLRAAEASHAGGEDEDGAAGAATSCGPASAATPGRIGAAAPGSPGTPRGSTFSVDAETVSLSVAMAGSAARPRAPAAAATTSETPGRAAAASTKDPVESQTVPAWPSGHTEGQATGSDSHEPIASTAEAHGPGGPLSPAAAAEAAGSVGTPGVSVRRRAGGTPTGACASAASGAGTSVGSLTPTSKPRPTLEATALTAHRPAGAPHASSPSPSAAAARRPAAAALRAARPGADPHRSSNAAEARTAPRPQSPAGGRPDVHACAGRPPQQHHHHHHQQQQQQPLTAVQPTAGAAAAPAPACSRPRDATAAGPDVAARASTAVTVTGRDHRTQHHHHHHTTTADEAAAPAAANACAAATAKAGGVVQATRSCGHPPPHHHHQSAGPHTAGGAGAGGVGGGSVASGHTPRSWLPGRASLQSHSIRSLAGRGGDAGIAGPSAGKPGGAAPASRISSASSAKSGIGGLHRPTSSSCNNSNNHNNTAGAASGGPSRIGSSAGTAAAAAAVAASHDQPLRHSPSRHRAGKPESAAATAAAAAAAVPSPAAGSGQRGAAAAPGDDEDTGAAQGPDTQAAAAQATAAVAAAHAVEAVGGAEAAAEAGAISYDERASREEAAKETSAVGAGSDGREAAAEAAAMQQQQQQQAAVADAASVLQQQQQYHHHQPQHSSRGYKPGGVTARTLASGTAANVASGAVTKGGVGGGGSLARTSLRGVAGATSVAGTTKRWM